MHAQKTQKEHKAQKVQKAQKAQKALKCNQAKAQNANKRTKIKNVYKKHLRGKKSLIRIFVLAKKNSLQWKC